MRVNGANRMGNRGIDIIFVNYDIIAEDARKWKMENRGSKMVRNWR
jgi:hypothetical protein